MTSGHATFHLQMEICIIALTNDILAMHASVRVLKLYNAFTISTFIFIMQKNIQIVNFQKILTSF